MESEKTGHRPFHRNAGLYYWLNRKCLLSIAYDRSWAECRHCTNRRCSGWTVRFCGQSQLIAMNTSGLLIPNMEKKGIYPCVSSEGCAIAFALAILFTIMESEWAVRFSGRDIRTGWKRNRWKRWLEHQPQGRIHAFAEAVDEVSAGNCLVGYGRQKSKEHLTIWIFLPRRLPEAVCGLRWMRSVCL